MQQLEVEVRSCTAVGNGSDKWREKWKIIKLLVLFSLNVSITEDRSLYTSLSYITTHSSPSHNRTE
jgi:hypothetical protein